MWIVIKWGVLYRNKGKSCVQCKCTCVELKFWEIDCISCEKSWYWDLWFCSFVRINLILINVNLNENLYKYIYISFETANSEDWHTNDAIYGYCNVHTLPTFGTGVTNLATS